MVTLMSNCQMTTLRSMAALPQFALTVPRGGGRNSWDDPGLQWLQHLCLPSGSEFRGEFFLELTLRMSARAKEAYLAPQRQRLDVDFKDGYAHAIVPSVEGHQMIVFEI